MEAIGQKYYEQTGAKVNFEVVTWPNTAENGAPPTAPDRCRTLSSSACLIRRWPCSSRATVPVEDVIEAIGGTDKF